MQDVACSNCRNRKVRCGRERPTCTNCSRDRVKCVYTTPTKRVNHVKVLCEGFGDLQNRLTLVQEELSSLTALFRHTKVSGALPGPATQPASEPETHAGPERGVAPLIAGYLTRSNGDSVEKYYGPWTLVALCREFGVEVSSRFGYTSAAGNVAGRMWLDAEDDLQQGFTKCTGTSIPLPPRQLLDYVLDRFFSRAEHATDIFVRPIFEQAVERVYANLSADSEAWAACFTSIILLVIGEDHGVNKRDPFTHGLIMAARTAAHQSTIFLTLRVVNVQALALLSLLVQQTHSETLGDALFSQACTLAKTMGLQHAGRGSTLSSLSAEEVEERQKIFHSLYVRDRCGAMLRGSSPWLTRFTLGLSPSQECDAEDATRRSQSESRSGVNKRNKAAWIELATLQGEMHHLIFSPQSPLVSAAECRVLLARIAQGLKLWSEKHSVPPKTLPSTQDDVSLSLAFLGTRIRAIEAQKTGEENGPDCAQVLDDARLSCLLLLAACDGLQNEKFVERTRMLLGSDAARDVVASSTPTNATLPSPPALTSNPPAEAKSTQQPPRIGIHRLALSFPAISLFILARHILQLRDGSVRQPPTEGKGGGQEESQNQVCEDRLLLEALWACFRDNPALQNNGPDNYTTRLGRIIERLVYIVCLADKHIDYDPEGELAGSQPDINTLDTISSPSFPLWGDSKHTSLDLSFPTMGYGGWLGAPLVGSNNPVSSLGHQWTVPGSSGYLGPGCAPTVSLPATMPAASPFVVPDMERAGTYPANAWEQQMQLTTVATQQQMQHEAQADSEGKRRRKRPRHDPGTDTES